MRCLLRLLNSTWGSFLPLKFIQLAPFTIVGLDFAGPFTLKSWDTYVNVFLYALLLEHATIEQVADFTTAAFIA